eukprot:GHVS01034798.1.p1 GENE.GHVS01034798.1~~GHVS01034798.1.p1  ORF type:complete len:904 (+),score=175.45 GHVS01034798.1:78-2789(+)
MNYQAIKSPTKISSSFSIQYHSFCVPTILPSYLLLLLSSCIRSSLFLLLFALPLLSPSPPSYQAFFQLPSEQHSPPCATTTTTTTYTQRTAASIHSIDIPATTTTRTTTATTTSLLSIYPSTSTSLVLFPFLVPSLVEASTAPQPSDGFDESSNPRPRRAHRSSTMRLSVGDVVGRGYLLSGQIQVSGKPSLVLPAPPPPPPLLPPVSTTRLPSSQPPLSSHLAYQQPPPSCAHTMEPGSCPMEAAARDTHTMKSLGFEPRPMLAGPEEGCENPLVYLGDLRFWVTNYKKPREETYTTFTPLGKGAFGEVWRALCLDRVHCAHTEVVLKRMFVDKGERVRLSGMREVYFGKLLQSQPCCVSRFIEFFRETPRQAASPPEETVGRGEQQPASELWLVFANEGYSLLNYFFQPNASGALLPSSFWWSLKRHPLGVNVLRDLMRQLLTALHAAHSRHITHRDVKLDNIFVTSSFPFSLRLGDWGSAVLTPPRQTTATPNGAWERGEEPRGEEDNVLKGKIASLMSTLYGPAGPSGLEESEGHRPPEALFGASAEDYHRPPSYDIWGAGVVLLQVVLGSKNVFALNNKRKEAKIHRLLRHAPPAIVEEAILLEALTELCLTPWAGQPAPRGSDRRKGREEEEDNQYERRDVAASAGDQRVVNRSEGIGEEVDEEETGDWTDWITGNLLARPWRRRRLGGEETVVLSPTVLTSINSHPSRYSRGLYFRPSTALTAHRSLLMGGAVQMLGRARTSMLSRKRSWNVGHVPQPEEELRWWWGGDKGMGGDGVREDNNADDKTTGDDRRGGKPSWAQSGEFAGPQYATGQCDDLTFGRLLENLDPAGVGLPDPQARHFLRSLLFVDKEHRITSEEALRHPWFNDDISEQGDQPFGGCPTGREGNEGNETTFS